MIHTTRQFDDRQRCSLTGKRVSPPLLDRRQCNCCGARLVKGFVMSNGDHIGEDCEEIICRATTALRCMFAADVEQFVASYRRGTGWDLRRSVQAYLGVQVFQ